MAKVKIIGPTVIEGSVLGDLSVMLKSRHRDLEFEYTGISDKLATAEFQKNPAKYDVLLGTAPVFASVEACGLVGNARKIARARLGLCIKSGTALWVPTVPELVALVRTSGRVVFGGPSVEAALNRLIEKNAISSEVVRTFDYLGTGKAVCHSVADGRASLGLTFENEAKKWGVCITTPLPADLQETTEYVGGISLKSERAEAAELMLTFLTSESVRSRLVKAAFLKPTP